MKTKILSSIFAASMALFGGSSAFAANATWNVNGAGTWSTSSNWLPAAAPGSTSSTTNTDSATFGTILTSATTVTVDANRNIFGINFAGNSSAYTLSGGNLLLTNGGLIQTSGGGSAHTDTINTPIQIQGDGGSATFASDSSTATRLLVLSGSVTGVSTSGSVTTLTLAGANTSGNNAVSGVITDGTGGGKLAIVKSGTGIWTLSGSNTFTGGVTINAGRLTAAGSSSSTASANPLGNSSGTIKLGGTSGSESATLYAASSAGTYTIANPITVQAGSSGIKTFGNSSNPVTYSGAITVNDNATVSNISGFTLTIGAGGISIASGKTLQLNSGGAGQITLTGITSGSGAVSVSGTNNVATVALGGQHTYTGGFTLGGSNVVVVQASSVGSAGNPTSGNFGAGTTASTLGTGFIRATTGTDVTVMNVLNMSGNITGVTTGTSDKSLIFSGPVTMTGATTLTSNIGATVAGKSLTFSGAIGDGGNNYGITQAGTGTLTFSGANTYAGLTAVNAGTVSVTGSNGSINASSGVTIAAGATLKLDNLSTANNTDRLKDTATITMNGGTFNFSNNAGAVSYAETTGTLSIAAGANTITASQSVSGTSTLTFAALAHTAGSTVNFAGTGLGADTQNQILFTSAPTLGGWATYNTNDFAGYGANGITAATYTDIDALGSTIADNSASNVRINAAGSGGNVALGSGTTAVNTLLQNTATASTLDTASKTMSTSGIMIASGQQALTIGAAAGDGTLTAATAGGDLSLKNNSSNALTINAAIADNTSASSLATSGAVILNGANTYTGVTAVSGSLTFGSNSDQTLIGAISGAGSLIKSGNGKLTLSASNSYTGGTTINGGTINVNSAASLGASTGNLTFAAGGGTLQLGATIPSSTRNIALSGSATIDTNGFDLTNSGVISGTVGSLTKTGNGKLTLAGANTYTGATTVSQGTVVAQNSAAFGTSAGGVTVADGATIDLAGSLANDALNLGTEVITISGTGVGGNGALIYSGTGTQINAVQRLVLGANASIGGVGRWDVRNTASLNFNGNTLTKTGTNYIALVGVTGTNAGNIDITQGILGLQTSTNLGGSSANTITVRNGGTLEMYQLATVIPWTVDLKDGSTAWSENGSGTQNNISGPVNLTGTATLKADNIMAISGAISGAGGSINKTGGSTLILTGSNSYDGPTTVSAGVLNIANNNALGTTAGATTVSSGAALQLANGIVVTGETVTINGNGNARGALQVSGTASAEWAGPVLIGATADSRVGAQASGTLRISGNISDGGGTNLVVSADVSNGKVILSGTGNNYSGETDIIRGTLALGVNNALPTTSLLNVHNGSSVPDGAIFDLNNYNQQVAGLTRGNNSGAGTVTNSGSTQSVLTISNTTNYTYDAAITGNLALIKTGAATQTLSGTNTYSGGTTVSQGGVTFANLSAKSSSGTHAFAAATTLGLGVSGSGNYFNSTDIDNAFAGTMTGNLSNVTVTATTNVGIDTTAGNFTYASSVPSVTKGLVKSGANTLTLSGSNAYSGGTVIIGGILAAANNDAMGTGAVSINAGAQRLVVNDGVTVANNININGGGASFRGLIENSGTGNAIVSGTITVNGGLAGGGDFAGASTGSLSVNGPIISGSANVSIRTGTVILAGGGSYANLDATGVAKLGATNGIATNATVNLGAANSAGTLDLAGFNQSVVGITKATSAAATVTNSGTNASLLTVTGSSTYAGIITNGTSASLALDVNGGYLTLTASNSYTGLTSVTAGTLAFDVSETLTGGLNVETSGTAILTAHTGTVKVLDITGLTISGTTAFVGGAKDLGGLASPVPAPVPEPGTIGLLAIGAVGGLLLSRRARRSVS